MSLLQWVHGTGAFNAKVISRWSGMLPVQIETGVQCEGIYLIRLTGSEKSDVFKMYLQPGLK